MRPSNGRERAQESEQGFRDPIQTIPSYGFGSTLSLEQRNKVMRNTYWLLALSLVLAVLGAWRGVATGITRNLQGGLGADRLPWAAPSRFMYAIQKKTKDSAAGVGVLLAFTFFWG